MTFPAVFGLAALLAATTPLAVPLLYLIDAARGARRGRWSRIWLLVLAAAATEIAGLAWYAGVRLAWLGRPDAPGSMAAWYRLEYWWTQRHLANVARFAGIRVSFDNLEVLEGGNAVLACRHVSHVDALVPALAAALSGNRVRYTLKRDLRMLPTIDLLGDCTPNVWIDRSPEPGSEMLRELAELGTGIGPGEVAVIFPESTFFTPERRERALERLAQTRPDLAQRAGELRRLLPPRPAGTLALLEAAPDADVVIGANVGLEHGGSLAEIARRIPERVTIRMHMWRYPRAALPHDADRVAEWLLDRWLDMDRWIAEQTEPLAAPPGAALAAQAAAADDSRSP